MPRRIRVSAALAAVVLISTLFIAPVAQAIGSSPSNGPSNWLALAWQQAIAWWADDSIPSLEVLLAPEGSHMDPDGTPESPTSNASEEQPMGLASDSVAGAAGPSI